MFETDLPIKITAIALFVVYYLLKHHLGNDTAYKIVSFVSFCLVSAYVYVIQPRDHDIEYAAHYQKKTMRQSRIIDWSKEGF